MGNYHWSSISPGKGKLEKKRVIQKRRNTFFRNITWGLALIAAFLFFVASFGDKINLTAYLDDLAKVALILLAMGMVFLSIRDKKDKIFQKDQKNKLTKTLEKQKKALRNHFDLQKRMSDNSSLNFVVGLEETLKSEETISQACPQTIAEKPSEENEEETITQEKVSFSQINLAKSVVEGEDISSFPPEWQHYFVENEGKTATEKLNKMLDIDKNEN